MANKNFNKILIFIILSLLVNLVVNGQQFVPEPRADHTATLLGEGNLSWVDLNSQGAKFPYTFTHTSDIGGANKDSIFIIGGNQAETTSLVYKFDTKTNEITTPIFQGKEPQRRYSARSVSYVGKIYIFSGHAFDSINKKNIYIDTFDILDTINMNWLVGSLVNAPPPRTYYTATLVNGVIYYIGGTRQDQSSTAGQIYVPMANISQYDINGGTWSLNTAIGVIPGLRAAHSAVLVNNKICIYGGIDGAFNVPSINQIAMLDPTTLTWSIPQLNPPNIPNLVFHTATQYGTKMLLAFGINIVGGEMNNKFYSFEFRNQIVTWTAQELAPTPPQSPKPSTPIPTPTVSTTTSPTDLTSPSTGVVVGLSVGLVAVGLAGIVTFSLVYRYKKKNKKNENASQIPIPSGDDIHVHYPAYQPQFAPYSNTQTSTLTQSQGRSLSQEFSTLPPSQERFSHHYSNYTPGSPPHNIYGTNQQPY